MTDKYKYLNIICRSSRSTNPQTCVSQCEQTWSEPALFLDYNQRPQQKKKTDDP